MRCSQEVKKKIRGCIVKGTVCKAERGWLCWIMGKAIKENKDWGFCSDIGGAGESIFSGVVGVRVWKRNELIMSKGCKKREKRNSS